MTESEWLACTDSTPMLEFLRDKATERKWRLFAVACCRRIWHLLADEHSQDAVALAERLADGMATSGQRRSLWKQLCEFEQMPWWQMNSRSAAGWSIANPLTLREVQDCASLTIHAALAHAQETGQVVIEQVADYVPIMEPIWGPMKAVQAIFLRDIFGNPFRPISLNPAWLTPTVVGLATVAYDERGLPASELDTARLAVLADGLEDAVCDNAELLAHCRGPGPHVRGCWAVDLLLGKS
jgi:hypothetical protein